VEVKEKMLKSGVKCYYCGRDLMIDSNDNWVKCKCREENKDE